MHVQCSCLSMVCGASHCSGSFFLKVCHTPLVYWSKGQSRSGKHTDWEGMQQSPPPSCYSIHTSTSMHMCAHVRAARTMVEFTRAHNVVGFHFCGVSARSFRTIGRTDSSSLGHANGRLGMVSSAHTWHVLVEISFR